MTLYIANAFSLNMLKQDEICLYVRKIDIEYARKLIERRESSIGYRAPGYCRDTKHPVGEKNRGEQSGSKTRPKR